MKDVVISRGETAHFEVDGEFTVRLNDQGQAVVHPETSCFIHKETISDESKEPTLNSFSVEKGVAEFKVGNAESFSRHLLASFHDELKEASNYIEICFRDPDNPPRQYTVTVQRHEGKTPAQVIAELKKQIEQFEKTGAESSRSVGRASH